AAMVVLAACAPAAAPAGQAGETGSAAATAQAAAALTIMAFGQADQPAFQGVADEYMKRNPDAKVEVVFLPNDESYYAALQTQYAGGSNPDIASMQGWGFQIFADNGALTGLNELRQRDSFDYAWADSQSVRDYTIRNGDTYLTPMQLATMVMFYAKKPFDEAGIAYPTDDWTMADFLEMAQALTDTSGDTKMFGYQANGNWVRDIHWICSAGVQEFDELVDPHTAMFDQPEIIETVQLFAQDVYYSMGISPTAADMEGGANTIDTGNAAMKYEGAWNFSRLNSPALREEGKEVEFDVVLMPKGTDEARPHRGWSEGVAIPATDKAEAAWQFAAYLGGPEGNQIYSEMTGRLPNSVELLESFWIPTVAERFGVQNGAAFLNAFTNSEVDVIGGVTRTQMWTEVVMPVGYDPLTNNSASAAEVMPAVNEGVQKLLDEYWANQ
ncbi:MAG: extracellular solute-binding protein, partial [Caldilineaceae bacterium]|nr:extracellular solute-binding protein [Caldilineaceae bacterium]